MAFFLARVLGSSFQQPPASLGGGGAVSASCCEGAVSRYAAVMPTTVQSDSGKRERSSAASNFVLMAAIMVPARADGDAGLEEVERELHPVLVLIVRSRARQQDLEADLGEEGQPNCQQVLEPVGAVLSQRPRR